jgi:hypothetical protein
MTDCSIACRCVRKEVQNHAKLSRSRVDALLEERDDPPLITDGSGSARIYNYIDGVPFLMKVRMRMGCQESMTTVFEWSVRPPTANSGNKLMYRPEISILGMERIVESLHDKLILLNDTTTTWTCNLTKAHIFLPERTNNGITNQPVAAQTTTSVPHTRKDDDEVVLVSVEITKLDPDNIATWVSANSQSYPLISSTNSVEQPRYFKHKVHHPVLHYGNDVPDITPAANLMSYTTYTREDGVIETDTSNPVIYSSIYRDSYVILQNRLSIYVDDNISAYYVCEYTINWQERTHCYQVIVCAPGMQRLFEYVYNDLVWIRDEGLQTPVYTIMSNGYDMSMRTGRRLTHFQIDAINPLGMFVIGGARCHLNPCVTYSAKRAIG